MRLNIFSWMAIISVIFSSTACSPNNQGPESKSINLEIKNGAYYINGEKTFINALGYEIGARPGQHPYEDSKELEIARMKNDLKLIKEAGFNAVRTWSELTEQEVALIQESGLMLVYGIWILPHGEFGDEKFVSEAKQQVRDVMSWSRNYNCIITYLIMNEPMPGHIFDKGAQNTYDLWTGLRDIIHEEHPGIPVTISNNSAIGEYLNMGIFDVYGYNTYDYQEGLPGHTQTFSNHFEYLKELNGEDKPVLVTEFGLSVSPVGWGIMYGGQTRNKQASHVINNFREVLNSGVAGICPFYYADGWWKAGEPGTHNPWPEEWFGYWGYADDTDTIGYPRPVWHEFKEYNQAIVGSPRTHEIYSKQVPVEFYLNEDITKAKVIYNDKVIFDKDVNGYYYTDVLNFDEDEITDRELIFEFYDADGDLIKWEAIMILTSKETVEIPTIEMVLNIDDLDKASNIAVDFSLNKGSVFQLDKEFKYIFSHHIGWEPGDHRTKEINPEENEISISDSFTIPAECIVLNVGAGIDIKFGKFTKRIYNQKLIYRGNWADPISVSIQ